jgi:cytochrome b561
MYWIVALLALAQLGIGWPLDYLPEGLQGSESTLWIHLALGLAALVIVVLIWRFFTRSTDYPPASQSPIASRSSAQSMSSSCLLTSTSS